MKNNNFKRSAASLLLASTLALTGCKGSFNNNKDVTETETLENGIIISGVAVSEDKIKQVVIGNKVVSVSDLRLADKDGRVIENIVSGVAGNKVVPVASTPFMILNSNIDYVLVDNELIPITDLVLINNATKEVVKGIDFVIIDGELVPFKDVVIGNSLSNNEKVKIELDYDNSAVITKGEEYEEFTTEKFEDLVAQKIVDFEKLGLSVKREDVIKYVMVFNIDKLKQDNPELVKEIIGNQVLIEVIDDAYRVSNVIATYEGRNLIANGQMFSVADAIFDKEQRKIVEDFEARKLAIINADDTQREAMFIKLCEDIYDPLGEFSKLEDASRMLMFRHALVVIHSTYFTNYHTYLTTLTGSSKELVFRLIAPYGATQDEIINSIMSGYERNMMASLTKCVENAKTLTK